MGNKRPVRMLWLLGLLLLIGSIGGTAWYLYTPGSDTSTAPAPPIDTSSWPVHAFGHLDVEGGVVALSPSQPGRVVAVNVQENQDVAKDTVIIQLDDSLAQLRVAEAEGALQAARTQLALARMLGEQHSLKAKQQQSAITFAEEAHKIAKSQHDRLVKLGSLANRDELAAAEARVQQALVGIKVEEAKMEELMSHRQDADLAVQRAQGEVDVLQSRLKQAKLAVDQCQLKAPAEGKVLRLLVNVGDIVGLQSLQPAVVFAPGNELVVRAEVQQEFASRVKPGLPVTICDENQIDRVLVDGLSVDRVSDWLARRRSILLEPNQVNDVRTLECIIKVPTDKAQEVPLRIGQRVHVVIHPEAAQATTP